MNLRDAIQDIQHDRGQLIYAELVEGNFTQESEAVYIKYNLGQDRVINDKHYFTHGERCGNALTEWRDDFYIVDYEEQWDKLVKLFEEENNCEWGGNKKEVEEWVYNCNSTRVEELIKEARDIFYNAVDDSWIQMLIDEVNEEIKEAP